MVAENHQQIFILVIVAFGLTETINNGSDPQKQQRSPFHFQIHLKRNWLTQSFSWLQISIANI